MWRFWLAGDVMFGGLELMKSSRAGEGGVWGSFAAGSARRRVRAEKFGMLDLEICMCFIFMAYLHITLGVLQNPVANRLKMDIHV